MKILASIPVEKVSRHGGFAFSFRHEQHEVEVLRVMRYPATRNTALNRWHYQADIADHPALCKEAIRCGVDNAYRVNIFRKGLNDKWRPPEFGASNWVDVSGESA